MSDITTEATDLSTTVPREDPTPFGWLNTADHKRIGRLFIGTSLMFLGLGLILDLLVRLDLTDDSDFVALDADTFGQLFVFGRESLVFLFLIPVFLGLAIYLVPLQVGASNLAFPRAGAAAFWGWLVSAGVFVGAYAGNGGPYGGWDDGVDLYMLALGGMVVSLLIGYIAVATTVLTERSPGMFLDRAAPFAWSTLVTASMLVVSLPVLLGQLVILYVDHRYGHVFLGGNFGIWGRIDWVVKTPTMFIYLVPVLGVAAEVVIATARRRVLEPLAMYFTIGLVGLFGFGAWMNFSITNEGSDLGDGFEGVVLVALYGGAALGATALVALLGFALFQSRKSLKLGGLNTSVLGVLGAGKFVVAAALYGLLGAGVDWLEIAGRGNDGNPYLRDTTWATGQQSILIYGAGLLGLVAALHWWAPKIWGRTLNDLLGKLTLLLIAVGATLATLGPALSGLLYDQPDLAYLDPAQTSLYAEAVDGGGAEAMAWLGTAGLLVVIAGALLFMLNLVVSLVLRNGTKADSDPWDGAAPEWMLDSPPRPGVLDALPDLDSGTPLLDMAEAGGDEQDAAEEVKV